MGNRLTRIYTRTGDTGTTGLGDGRRVAKDDPQIEAIGAVDELNSLLGLLLTHPLPEAVRAVLTRVQHELFDLGGELCLPGHGAIREAHIRRLEQELDGFNAMLPPLKEFILPGGSAAAATCHLARTVCRRAEREVVALHRTLPLRPELLGYLNRLSDLLFVVARLLARADGGQEVLWQPLPHDGGAN